jgi:hypothetical protein
MYRYITRSVVATIRGTERAISTLARIFSGRLIESPALCPRLSVAADDWSVVVGIADEAVLDADGVVFTLEHLSSAHPI